MPGLAANSSVLAGFVAEVCLQPMSLRPFWSTLAEVDDHLMVLHAFPAFYKTQVPHDTIMTVAHASEATIPEHLAKNAPADDSVKS